MDRYGRIEKATFTPGALAPHEDIDFSRELEALRGPEADTWTEQEIDTGVAVGFVGLLLGLLIGMFR